MHVPDIVDSCGQEETADKLSPPLSGLGTTYHGSWVQSHTKA